MGHSSKLVFGATIMSKADLKLLDEKIETIQDGFQRVLAEHGIKSLTVSHFRLAEKKAETSMLAAADSQGCWKWVCEMTPTGKVCHKVWDPNC
jgi:hypothetical protein